MAKEYLKEIVEAVVIIITAVWNLIKLKENNK